MRSIQMGFSAICLGTLLTGAALGQSSFLDVGSATVDVAVTNAELDAATSTTVSLRGMGIRPNGNLVVWDADGDSSAEGLLNIDVSGAIPAITTLVAGADLLAVADDDIQANAIRVASDETIYVSEFGGTDEIIKIVDPGGTGETISVIRSSDGVVGIALSSDQSTIHITLEQAYGATEDAIVSIPNTGGTDTVLLSQTDFISQFGGSECSFSQPAIDADGNILTYSEAHYGGTDDLIAVDPSGPTASIKLAAADLPGGEGSSEALAVDSHGDLFLFNAYPASGVDAGLVVVRAGGSAVTAVTYDQIAAVTGGSAFEAEDVAVWEANDQVTLYVTDDETQQIVSITFDLATNTSVGAYELYR
jgi:hypothetical protein